MWVKNEKEKRKVGRGGGGGADPVAVSGWESSADSSVPVAFVEWRDVRAGVSAST